MIIVNEEIKDAIDKLSNLKVKNALDLGCGKGRIALPLADRGVKVVGVDTKNCSLSHKNFEFVNEDVRRFKFNKKFDLIICSLVLHFMKKEKARGVLEMVKQNTTDHGLNLIICLSNEDELSKEKSENFYPSLSLLKQIYSGWEPITELQDFTEVENHDNLGDHVHNIIFLLAKRP